MDNYVNNPQIIQLNDKIMFTLPQDQAIVSINDKSVRQIYQKCEAFR